MSVKPKRSKIDISHNHNNSISANFRSRFIILIAAEYLHDLPHELRLVIISQVYFLTKKGCSHVEKIVTLSSHVFVPYLVLLANITLTRVGLVKTLSHQDFSRFSFASV